jgi:flavorubredoxin
MLAAFRMNTDWQVPLERVYVLSFDEKISVGDRKLIPIKPPLYDAPYTIGLFDEKSGALFSVDAFGAVLKRKERDVADFSEKELVDGMTAWASFDSPWVHMIDEQKYRNTLNQIQELNPKLILPSHLPTARGKTSQLVDVLSNVPSAKPFSTPNQEVFSRIMMESEEIFTY